MFILIYTLLEQQMDLVSHWGGDAAWIVGEVGWGWSPLAMVALHTLQQLGGS
jgi:hypothetical protein